MQALVLAGGKGTRLRPYTMVFPKPMLPVDGRPIIDIIINQLSNFGFDDVTISLGYLGKYIEMYFEDKSNIPPGMTIRYFTESRPLGTSGPVALLDDPDENFLVINGDILSSINYSNFFAFHTEQNAVLSMAVGIREVKMSLGVLEFGNDHRIKSFVEKPTYTYHDNMGIYVYNRKALSYIEKDKKTDLNDLVSRLLEKEEKVCGFLSGDPYYWIDIGQHADYEKANIEFEKRKEEFLGNRK